MDANCRKLVEILERSLAPSPREDGKMHFAIEGADAIAVTRMIRDSKEPVEHLMPLVTHR